MRWKHFHIVDIPVMLLVLLVVATCTDGRDGTVEEEGFRVGSRVAKLSLIVLPPDTRQTLENGARATRALTCGP